VNIVVEGYEFESLLEKTTADLTAKTGQYDCIMAIYYNLGKYVENGWVIPVDDFLKDPNIITTEEYNSIVNGMIPGAWESKCEYKGKYYGFPFSCQTQFEWYRGDLFNNTEEQDNFKSQYGYALDHPKTWQEWSDQSEFFTRKKGETLAGETLDFDFYGTCLQAKRHPSTWYEFICFFPSFGGKAFDNGEIAINGPEVVEALDFYKSLTEFSPPGVLEYTWDDALIAMAEGLVYHCVMWYDATFAVVDPDFSKVADKMAFHAPLPVKDPAIHSSSHSEGGWSFLVNAFGKHPAEAAKFVAWTAKPEIQILWGKNSGLPHSEAAYKDPEIAALPMTEAALLGNLNSAFTMHGVWAKDPWAEETYDKGVLAVSQATSGAMSSQEALDWYAEEIERITGMPRKYK
jgi:multiple sugar transport system substrate-binding protein